MFEKKKEEQRKKNCKANIFDVEHAFFEEEKEERKYDNSSLFE